MNSVTGSCTISDAYQFLSIMTIVENVALDTMQTDHNFTTQQSFRESAVRMPRNFFFFLRNYNYNSLYLSFNNNTCYTMLECPLWHPGLLYATVDIDRQRIPRHYGPMVKAGQTGPLSRCIKICHHLVRQDRSLVHDRQRGCRHGDDEDDILIW